LADDEHPAVGRRFQTALARGAEDGAGRDRRQAREVQGHHRRSHDHAGLQPRCRWLLQHRGGPARRQCGEAGAEKKIGIDAPARGDQCGAAVRPLWRIDHHSDRPINTAPIRPVMTSGMRATAPNRMIPPRTMIAQKAPCSREAYCASVPLRTRRPAIDRTKIAPIDKPSAITTMLFDSAKAPITPSKLNEASSTLR